MDAASNLGNRLGFDKTVNIGQSGGCNERTFRTTMDYILTNNDVSFVIIMLTFWNRLEAPWAAKPSPGEGKWLSYAANGLTEQLAGRMDKTEVERNLIDQYIIDRFRYDINEDYIDKLLMDIITLGSWLQSKGIQYCMFNTCDLRIPEFLKMPNFKYRIVEKNPSIIDLKNFLSNQYIYANGGSIPEVEVKLAEEQNRLLQPELVHYDNHGSAILNNFLYNYISENILNK
jgi:hypothetical protein